MTRLRASRPLHEVRNATFSLTSLQLLASRRKANNPAMEHILVDVINDQKCWSEWQLPVPDLLAAARYYSRVLGFSTGSFWGSPPRLLFVSRDQTLLLLREVESASQPPTVVSIPVQDLGSLESELVARGVEVRRGSSEAELDLWVVDCAGHDLHFVETPQGSMAR